MVRDRYGNASAWQIVVASPLAPQSATVWGMSGQRPTGLAFADQGRQLWVNAGGAILRFRLADLIAPTQALRLTGDRGVAGLALDNDGSLVVIDAGNSLYQHPSAAGAALEGSHEGPGVAAGPGCRCTFVVIAALRV